MAAASYQLEHFYYGQFARDGKPFGEARLLAHSNDIKPETVQELVEQTSLPPFEGAPDASWALVRGKTVPFLLIQSQQGEAGQLMTHYVLVRSDVLRALGGNIDVLRTLVEGQMPTYDRLGDRLPPLSLPQAGPPAADAQIDHILDLMNYTQNRVNVIEALLAGVVQGVQIIIQGAPNDLDSRVGLIKGLLALLPPPARFGVTFTTYSEHDTNLDAQIRFYSDDKPPAETLVFNWPDASLSGKQVEDGYSHFVISQLRLDAELVIKETQALTAVAAWRIKQGDTLAQALAYGSKRRAVDQAVRHNMPVEIDDVSEILSSDPTLDEELSRVYATHLMSLSLAMEDMQYADPVGLLSRREPELEERIRQQLREALAGGKIELVYATLERWLGHPMGPQGREWVQLAHDAVLARMDQLGKARDVEQINAFLSSIHSADPGLEISRVVPRLIEMALPLSLRHRPLAETIFLLAINHLEHDVLVRLLESSRFLAQLPKPLEQAVPYVTARNPDSAPAGILSEAAESFDEEWQPLVMVRLTEAALNARRIDLLDTAALASLAKVARTEYNDLLRGVVTVLSDDDVLPTLEAPGPFHLLQIALALGEYRLLAREILHQSRLLYRGDSQVDYALMLERLFVESSLPAADAYDALSVVEESGVRSLPLALMRIGVLETYAGDEGSESLANTITNSLFSERTMLDVMPPRPIGELLLYYIRKQDVLGTARVASLFPEAAASKGNAGIVLMIRMYKALDWHDELKLAALESLRRYIRQCDTTSARKAIVQFGRELGLKVREALEATYAIKRVMAGVDFIDYAHFLRTTAELLEHTGLAYADRNNLPTLGALVNAMQALGGGLMDDESKAIANAVLDIGRSIVMLGDQYRARIPRDADRYINSLLAGEANPRSGLDVLWIMGGYFAKGKRYRMKMTHTRHPLGERSAPMLKDEAEITNQLLRGVVQAFPPDKDVRITAEAIRGEIESLWGVIDEDQRKSMVRDLALNAQRIVQLVAYIEANGDPRALQKGSMQKLEEGKQQPKSTLEFYRYVHGYFNVP